MKKIISILFFALCVLHCFPQDGKLPLWLLGTWEINTNTGPSFEEWTLVGDTMQGKTYRNFYYGEMILDTKYILVQEGVPTYFITATDGSNQKIPYKYEEISADVISFKNEDSSPSALYFQKLSDTIVYFWIESSYADVEFEMKKIK